jgi:O-antigen ligase
VTEELGRRLDPASVLPATAGPARRWTRAVVLATVILLPLVFVPAFPDAFALPKLVLLYALVPLAAAGPVLGLILFGVRRRGRPRAADVAALAFAVLVFAAWTVSAAPGHDLQGEPFQYQGLLPLLLYVASYGLARVGFGRAADVAPLVVAMTSAGCIVAAYAIVQQLGLDPIWHVLDKGRVFSSLGQADALAAYLVLALPGAVALTVTRTGRARAISGAAALLMVVALLLTLSRGGYLGLAAEVVVGIVLLAGSARARVPWRFGWLRAAQALAVAGIALLALLAVPTTRHGVESIAGRALSTGNLQEGSIRGRLDLWAVGVRITLDHPLLGTGPDSYVLEFPAYRDAVLPAARATFMTHFRPESPHSVYLALASGLGLPALACYLALIVGVLILALRSLRVHDWKARVLVVALIAAIVGHVVTDGFMTGEIAGSWLFWVLLGAAVSSSRLGRDSDTGFRPGTAPGSP